MSYRTMEFVGYSRRCATANFSTSALIVYSKSCRHRRLISGTGFSCYLSISSGSLQLSAETCPAWIHPILVIGHHVHCYFKISKNLESFVKNRSRTGLWAGFDKYPISLTKAYYGDAATGGAVLNFFQASRMRMQFVGVRSLGAKVPARDWQLRVAFDRK
jgi:hypothetical protein